MASCGANRSCTGVGAKLADDALTPEGRIRSGQARIAARCTVTVPDADSFANGQDPYGNKGRARARNL